MLMVANLVGFVIGLEGIRYLGTQLIGTWGGECSYVPHNRDYWLLTEPMIGIGFLFLAIGCLFIGVQIMLEYREEERRSGVYRKC
jgi:protein-cysteine N-palmitoyltransferase HHAT